MTATIVEGFGGLERASSAVAIGFFDGVHRGHGAIIDRARQRARERGLRSVVVTFDRHPMEVVAPGSQPRLLQTPGRRVRTLAEQGVDVVVVLPFDDDLRHLAPEGFVGWVLSGPLEAAAVVVGENFRFGHKAAGDVATLAEIGAREGFSAEGVTLLTDAGGAAISSTAIRTALDEGDVVAAGRMLGRPHAVDGLVVRGDRRGASLGYPTANLHVDARLAVPAPGVYATEFCHPDGRVLPAATSVGTNPTFGGHELRVEAHLLDVDEDLYGLDVALAFRERIRGQVAFDRVEDLVAQMDDDVAAVRRVLGA
ncbi:MAG: bifunctional riboflavin kinase/FAD synthetase [Actinomycetota bacterium]